MVLLFLCEMGRKCCVPGCRSNYNPATVNTTTFKFPKDILLREKWVRNIRRQNLKVTQNTVVCVKHFDPKFVLREDVFPTLTGDSINVPRKVPKLANDAYPTIIPNPPYCQTKTLPVEKTKDKDIGQRLEMDVIGSHRSCCVVNCPNNEKTCSNRPNIKFYSFPGKFYELERKQKWVSAVNRRNLNGTLWQPSVFSRICSEHFVGGKLSDNEGDPGYIPTIFPTQEKLPLDREYSLKKLPVNKTKLVKTPTPLMTSTPITRTPAKKMCKIYPLNPLIEKTLLNSKSTQVRFQFDRTKFIFSSVPDDSLTGKHKIIECNIGYNLLDCGQSKVVRGSLNEEIDCAIDSDDCIDCDDDDHCNHEHNYHKRRPNHTVKMEDKSCGPDGLLLSEVLIDIYKKRRKII